MAPNLAYVHNGRTRFVEIDLQLLHGHFEVGEFYIGLHPLDTMGFLDQLRSQDLVLGWFASWHTLLPVVVSRRLNIPSILIVGGYDTANVPAAGYGSQRGGIRRMVANSAINRATHLITNSQSARNEVIQQIRVPEEKISVIYHGVPEFPAGDMAHRKRIALTVGGVWRENLLRKGLLPFVEAAAFLPDVEFVLVGKWYDDSIDDLRRVAGPNVTFTGFIPDNELEDLYTQAAVYVQPSLHEGFGMSVAEAMVGGCIPVVTRNGSLPEVVGNTGIYCDSNDPQEIASAIEIALTKNGDSRQEARVRVLHKFPLERREEALVELVQEVLANS